MTLQPDLRGCACAQVVTVSVSPPAPLLPALPAGGLGVRRVQSWLQRGKVPLGACRTLLEDAGVSEREECSSPLLGFFGLCLAIKYDKPVLS